MRDIGSGVVGSFLVGKHIPRIVSARGGGGGGFMAHNRPRGRSGIHYSRNSGSAADARHQRRFIGFYCLPSILAMCFISAAFSPRVGRAVCCLSESTLQTVCRIMYCVLFLLSQSSSLCSAPQHCRY